MIHLVTFSDASMSRSAELCVSSAKRHGVDEAWHYEKQHVWSTNFYTENKSLLDQPRGGGGYFAWKPRIIQDTMRRAEECYSGEQYVVYADAGVEFINNQRYIIDRMDQDIFLFGNNWEHAHWCKADILEEIIPMSTGNPDLPWRNTAYTLGKQCQASVIFFRVSDYSRAFVAEWLKWCLFEEGRLIDDSPSRIRNHPEFQENRHDQAILTTMAYREGLRLHYWPASYNDGQFIYEKLPEYASDDYPALFNHHRRRDHEWSVAA